MKIDVDDLATFATLQGQRLDLAWRDIAELVFQFTGKELTDAQKAKLKDSTAWHIAHAAALGLGFRK